MAAHAGLVLCNSRTTQIDCCIGFPDRVVDLSSILDTRVVGVYCFTMATTWPDKV